MSYDPADRFSLDNATAERLADLAEQIEVKARAAYHAAECGTHDVDRCGYTVPTFEVLADLHDRGLLTLPPATTAEDKPFPIVTFDGGGTYWVRCSGCGKFLNDIEEGIPASWLANSMGNHVCP